MTTGLDIDLTVEGQAWIHATLKSDPNVLAAFPDIVNDLYSDVADRTAGYPHVVVGYTGGSILRAVGGRVVWGDLVYLVRVVGEDPWTLRLISGAINAALDGATGLTDTVRIVDSFLDSPYRIPEDLGDGVSIENIGGMYRLKVQPL